MVQYLKDGNQNHQRISARSFKEDLEAAILEWIDNRAKSKKYAAIGKELAEFEEALKEADSNLASAAVKAKKMA